jgi:(1->4)-alpha-D-glucan 1-alpha-D-glucosylmutase
MRIPTATYRIQFNKDFTFTDLERIIPYLHDLGISDIYASPIFKARTGSTHGYDIIDPTTINPTLGTETQLNDIATNLRTKDMGWIQDIVPNHLAYDHDNTMLMDILENGPRSRYHKFFDVQWNPPNPTLKNRILAPFLNEPYGDAITHGKISITHDKNGFHTNFQDQSYPLRIDTYPTLLTPKTETTLDDKTQKNLATITEKIDNLPFNGPAREDQIQLIKDSLWDLTTTDPAFHNYITSLLTSYDATTCDESCYQLDQLLARQTYRLSYWKVATEELNYRRFFTLNHLIALRTQDHRVFTHIHSYIKHLLSHHLITGLRVDHIDGLYSPHNYLQRLNKIAPDAYIIVEKILKPGETLPPPWPCQGTTGYDFLFHVNNILCDHTKQRSFTSLYQRIIKKAFTPPDLIYNSKRLILQRQMLGDIENLAYMVRTIASKDRHGYDLTATSIKAALIEYMARLPVYRSYLNLETPIIRDEKTITDTIHDAITHNPHLTLELTFLNHVLLLHYRPGCPQHETQAWIDCARRIHQFTAVLMAKGLEDTVYYIYNQLLALNEVGGDPSQFGITLQAFHRFNTTRHQTWPHALNTTATHDTKLGEDARARLLVLSEIPAQWHTTVNHWKHLTQHYKTIVDNTPAPSNNDEYALYQTLLAALPTPHIDDAFITRIQHHMLKAVREAERHTAWLQPNTAYENATIRFIDQILRDGRFLTDFLSFYRTISFYGTINSLTQTLLKITAPGIPDFYQGTELWDYALVDPDNRNPVDYHTRQHALTKLTQTNTPIKTLLTNPTSPDIKLYTIHKALHIRHTYKNVFDHGNYIPLTIQGTNHTNAIAYARTHHNTWIITIAPRHPTSLTTDGCYPTSKHTWHDTHLLLPPTAPHTWTEHFTTTPIQTTTNTIPLYTILHDFPLALLTGDTHHAR